VREHERVIKKERLVLLARDKINRVVAHDVRPVFVVLVVVGFAVHLQTWVLVAIGPAIELPQAVFIKAKVPRPFEAVAELPLARDARRVAVGLHDIAKGRLRGIEMSEVRVIAAIAHAAHQLHARRCAERLRIAVFEAHSGCRELVHVRSLVALAAVRGHAFVTEVVDEDEDDIGFALSTEGERDGGEEQEKRSHAR
jgi:hypothetical protein